MDLCSTAACAAGEVGNVAKTRRGALASVGLARSRAGVGRVLEGLTITRAYSYTLADTSGRKYVRGHEKATK